MQNRNIAKEEEELDFKLVEPSSACAILKTLLATPTTWETVKKTELACKHDMVLVPYSHIKQNPLFVSRDNYEQKTRELRQELLAEVKILPYQKATIGGTVGGAFGVGLVLPSFELLPAIACFGLFALGGASLGYGIGSAAANKQAEEIKNVDNIYRQSPQ